MALKKKNRFKDSCDDWDDYMAQKKAKLEEQFQEAAKHEFSKPSHIFNGVAIFVNGYTSPTADELKRLMMAHGGIYHHYLRSQSTTHMIASNLPYSKIVAYRKAQKPLPLCKPEWITDSIKAGKLLDHRNYLLYSQCTETQPAIFSHFKQNKPPQAAQPEPSSTNSVASNETVTLKPEEEKSSSTSHPAIAGSAIANCTKNPEFLTEFYNNSRLHHISTMGAMFKEYINDLRDKHDGTFPGLGFLKKQSYERHKAGPSTRQDDIESDEELFDEELPNGLLHQKSVPITNKNPIIMHIDMDCFFVSVGLRKNPELRGFPVAVAHAKGNKSSDNTDEYGSMSEVASCSYEARKAGVKNGMFLGKALKLCPNLKVIRYDFEGYKEVSYTLYDTVASYTLDIEAVSCDEMYADCTKILQESKLSPLEFATIIRSEIKKKTGCPVSTGFGHNKLQARLATKKAKPDGQYFLTGDAVISFIRTLNVKDLPGVGWSTSNKLAEMNIEICANLEAVPLYDLQKEFGKKNGQQLYDMCRGIDNTKLSLEHVRKSVSAEVNYGIRFDNTAAAHDFLKKLSEEVSDRLKKISSKGKCVTLKVLFRAKDAPNEPRKFMGHGVCDAFNKSKNLVAPTDDPVTIGREVINLWNQFQQSPENARGIGIQMTKLESTKNKASGSTIFKFIDNMKAAAPNDKSTYRVTASNTNKQQSTRGNLMDFFQPDNNSNSNNSNLTLQNCNKASSSVESRLKSNEIQLYDKVLDNLINEDTVPESAKHENVKAYANNEITTSIENQFSKEIYFEDEHKDDLDNEELGWKNSNNTDPNFDNYIESEEIKFDDDELNEVLGNEKNKLRSRSEDSNLSDRNVRLQPNLESNSDNSNHCQNSKRENEQKTKTSSQLRQTKQSQFFKQTKPFASNRAGKVQLPELQEIDMQVLIELPEDIRNEILNEYKEKKNENVEDEDSEDFRIPERPIQSTSNQANTGRNEEDISFSQIDPEFLAALPNDMKNEVKHYCDAQRKAKKPQSEDKRINNGWNIFKNDEKPQKNTTKSKRGRPRLVDRTAKSKEKKPVASTSTNQFARETETSNVRVDISEKNQKNQLNEETSAANKSFYFDNSQGNSEHNEILSNLVSCLLELPITQVKLQIMQWIRNSLEVNDVDFLSLTTYLGTLPRKHRLVDLHILMKCLHRCITATESCIWHDTYKKMVAHVQIRMRQEYKYDLMIPSEVECNRCNVSTL